MKVRALAVVVLVTIFSGCIRSGPDELTLDERLERTIVQGPGPIPALVITTTDTSPTTYDAAQLVHLATELDLAVSTADLRAEVYGALQAGSVGVPPEVALRFLAPWSAAEAERVPEEVTARVASINIRSGTIDDFGADVDALLIAPDALGPQEMARLAGDLRSVTCGQLLGQLQSDPLLLTKAALIVEVFSSFDLGCDAEGQRLQEMAELALSDHWTSGELRAVSVLFASGLVQPFPGFDIALSQLADEPEGTVELRSPTIVRELAEALLLSGNEVPDSWKQNVGARIAGEENFVFEEASVLADVIRALEVRDRRDALKWISDNYRPEAADPRDRLLLDQALRGVTGADLDGTLSQVPASDIVMAIARQLHVASGTICDAIPDASMDELRVDLKRFQSTRNELARPAAIAPAASTLYILERCGGDATGGTEFRSMLKEEIAQLDVERSSADALFAYVFADCMLNDTAPSVLTDEARSRLDADIPNDPAQIARVILARAGGDTCNALW